MLLFLWSTYWAGVASYSALEIGKDGEFCNYKQSWEANYDFEFNALRCDFLWSGLIEPFIALVVFSLIGQIPLWTVYDFVRLFIKNLEEKMASMSQV